MPHPIGSSCEVAFSWPEPPPFRAHLNRAATSAVVVICVAFSAALQEISSFEGYRAGLPKAVLFYAVALCTAGTSLLFCKVRDNSVEGGHAAPLKQSSTVSRASQKSRGLLPPCSGSPPCT
jgi:hypothetical protein